MRTVEVWVPELACRHDVRAVSAGVTDVPGVIAVEVDRTVRRIRVYGDVTASQVRAAITAAGYRAEPEPAAG